MRASQVLETHLKRIRVLGGRRESMFSTIASGKKLVDIVRNVVRTS